MKGRNIVKTLTFRESKKFDLDKDVTIDELLIVNNTLYPISITLGTNFLIDINDQERMTLDSLDLNCSKGNLKIYLDTFNQSLDRGHNVRITLIGRKINEK